MKIENLVDEPHRRLVRSGVDEERGRAEHHERQAEKNRNESMGHGRASYSPITGANVQSDSVMKTASKNISIESHVWASARFGSAAKIAAVPCIPPTSAGSVMG